MRVVLKHTMNRIKNGFAASSPQLGIAAHGHSPEVARDNLGHSALLFLRPLGRQGILMEELAKLGLEVQGEEGELIVVVTEEQAHE